MKITRGLGGPQGIKILILTCVIGVVLILLGLMVRSKALAPKGVVAVELPPEQVLALGEKARGPLVELGYVRGDMARVASFAVARGPDGRWNGLPAGTILQVTSTAVHEGDTWVTGVVQGGLRKDLVMVHASFLERYLPVVLPERTLEVSDLRLLVVKSPPQPGWAVSGWLRNISSQVMSQCVVTCVFQDANEREVGISRSEPMDLPPLQMVRFQTAKTDRPFSSIAIQITHVTPEGLMNYLSTIVIKRSALQ